MQTAVRIALLKWLKAGPLSAEPSVSIPFIGELSFNEASTLRDCLKTPLTFALKGPGELSLQIPGMIPSIVFTAPSNTAGIQFEVALACCNVTNAEVLHNVTTILSSLIIPPACLPKTSHFPYKYLLAVFPWWLQAWIILRALQAFTGYQYPGKGIKIALRKNIELSAPE